MERLGIPSSRAAAWARNEELNLNNRLLQGEDTAGVFGSTAGRSLKRLPSVAYWGGLASWGIRLFPGIADAYFRSLDAFYRRLSAHQAMPSDPEGRSAAPSNWHPHVPEPPAHFPYDVAVALRPEDAVYLCDRIQARHAGSLLAVLVSRRDAADLDAVWPWHLAERGGVSPGLRERLRHARLFAVTLHGAALLYNLMLAELRGDARLVETYRRDLDAWALEVDALHEQLTAWRLAEIWAVVRGQGRSLGYPTRTFVQSWVDGLLASGPRAVVHERSPARKLVRDREIRLKRGRARLASPRHLELWGGASGTDRMGFRWSGSRVILEDLFDGLKGSAHDARDA